MTRLQVIHGGRAPRPSITVPVSDLEGMHLEVIAARAERTVYAARMHELIRRVARHVSTAHYAAAGTALLEMDRLTAQEAMRAQAMDAVSCPCGCEGSGHGPADSDAVAA